MKFWNWDVADRIAYFAAVTAGAGFLTALCVFLVRAGDGDADDWAAWVQAIGSIVAIWAAFKISQKQHLQEMKSQARVEARATKARMEMAVAIAFDALGAANEALEYLKRFENGSKFTKRPSRLEDAKANLRSLIDQPCEVSIAPQVLEIMAAVSRTVREFEAWHGDEPTITLEARSRVKDRFARIEKSALKIPGYRQYRDMHMPKK